jgi:hypothetical protein
MRFAAQLFAYVEIVAPVFAQKLSMSTRTPIDADATQLLNVTDGDAMVLKAIVCGSMLCFIEKRKVLVK